MPFQRDQAYADDVKEYYGTYHSTFRSENEQIVAHLFQRGEWLVAYVHFVPPWNETNVTDAYRSELHRYANEHGFERKLQVVYSEESRRWAV